MVDILGAARTVVAGGVGGLCLWSAIFPTDVVKSRIQVESTVGKKAPGFLTTFNRILKTEGQNIACIPYTHKHISICTHSYMYVHLHNTHVNVNFYTCIHIYKHTHLQIVIPTYAHIFLFTHLPVLISSGARTQVSV